ncbi:MAG: triose-phosphate isomerase [Saccharospirillum sp.]|nr:triose-phosphate isomerase [Saccharospirillum sp.]
MKKPLWIGTSWKMNKTLAEAVQFADALSSVAFSDRVTPFVIPSFTNIREVKQRLANTPVKVGAQNMHWAEAGAWTGEVSPLMLKDCLVDLVEIGHSERRTHFGETDETVGLKVQSALKHGLTPLVCIGETESDLNNNRADEVLSAQVLAAINPSLAYAREHQPEILFAYEPVWAIGENGRPASSAYANDRHKKISAVLKEALGYTVPCLYGGSVNPDNACDLIEQHHIDGLFIGRSAWNVEGFVQILTLCNAIRNN